MRFDLIRFFDTLSQTISNSLPETLYTLQVNELAFIVENQNEVFKFSGFAMDDFHDSMVLILARSLADVIAS